jgi:hypothetical protein
MNIFIKVRLRLAVKFFLLLDSICISGQFDDGDGAFRHSRLTNANPDDDSTGTSSNLKSSIDNFHGICTMRTQTVQNRRIDLVQSSDRTILMRLGRAKHRSSKFEGYITKFLQTL